MLRLRSPIVFMAIVAALTLTLAAPGAIAFAVCPDGQIEAQPGVCVIDGAAVPKYVTPLVIPPVMNNDGENNNYDIAVRQFQQQILPGGHWNAITGRTDEFPATTVWSYGPAEDELPDSSALPGGAVGLAPAPNSQFNYPAYTFETKSNRRVNVRWINDLVNPDGTCRSHLLPIDQTLHWANPPQECREGGSRTDCAGTSQEEYAGPVPIVTHVHGAHVDPHSDGYPEAWWLPACNDIPGTYAKAGTLFDDATGTNNGAMGYADFSYRQDQPATTLWYHDHTLGMTRSNVYAGPAGFWLIRGGQYDKVDNVWTRWWKWDGILPGPAPKRGDTVLQLNAPSLADKDVRSHIREIPVVIQDRSFNTDGSLFYPANRDFFEGLAAGDLATSGVQFAPISDVAPIWNPEAFFNVMVVNGVSWPTLDVAPAFYRFRLLNGCNSRFLNLSMKIVSSPIKKLEGKELSFYQIGAEQGFLPKVAEIRTGFATPLPGNGRRPRPADRVSASNPQQALLMALAERADVIVDFRFLPNGTVIQMNNTAPDAPFGGFPDTPADAETTGQVMQFVVKWNMWKAKDLFSTPPWALKLKAEPALNGEIAGIRTLSLNELESENQFVCFIGEDIQVGVSSEAVCVAAGGEWEPFGPTEALLGTVVGGEPVSLKWSDPITENPALDTIEQWDIYNVTADAHPIHLHLVRFEVINREGLVLDGEGEVLPPLTPDGAVRGPEPWETGYKDTVISYPGEVTRVKALFDIEGLYVWHCHIVEHEDNEMMRPFWVGNPDLSPVPIAGGGSIL